MFSTQGMSQLLFKIIPTVDHGYGLLISIVIN